MHNRYTWVTGKEPLTYYDMNLSAQDHQTFFTGDTQQLRPEDAGEFESHAGEITTLRVCLHLLCKCSYAVAFLCVCFVVVVVVVQILTWMHTGEHNRSIR